MTGSGILEDPFRTLRYGFIACVYRIQNYWNYYEAIFPMIVQGGLIVVDNVLWSGRVLNPVDASDKAIHQFNERVKHDARVESVMLTVRDGIYCLRKR